MATHIRDESVEDHEAIRLVNRRAFGQEGESRLVDALREQGYLRVSLVAEQDGQIVGHILFSDLPIISESGTVPAISLAPLTVLPEYQWQGVGSALVREGLQRCRTLGHKIVIVLGHPDYYPRFGFSPQLARRLVSPFSGEAFMALEVVPSALDDVAGAVSYPPPFGAVG